MSTRCGDLDPAITLRLLHDPATDNGALETLLNKRSGVLGLTAQTADIRDVVTANHRSASLAPAADRVFQIYTWRIRKYLGAYLATINPAHAVIFTDTIGETVPAVRWAVCAGLEVFGLRLDADRNEQADTLPADVAATDSSGRILVIRTNEELAIARSTFRTLTGPAPAFTKEMVA